MEKLGFFGFLKLFFELISLIGHFPWKINVFSAEVAENRCFLVDWS